MRARLAIILGVAALAVVGVVALLGRGGQGTPVPVKPDFVPTPPGEHLQPLKDPFSYDPARRRQFEARAAAGNAHVLYALSPGGAPATAARVAGFRPLVNRAAKAAHVSTDDLEALVFLESAGRSDVLAPTGTEGAAGLTQILAETGINLLGMRVDVERSRRLSKRISSARSERTARRLAAERRAVDERFDPVKALAATGRYLELAEQRFDSEELAFVSYHMGIGNLESVLDAYAQGKTDEPLRYAQVYFDSSPTSHESAYAKLYSLGDDSSNYLWKLRAAKEILRLYRTDPEQLDQTAALQSAKNSAEEVLPPSATTEAFAPPGQLQAAWAAAEPVALGVSTQHTG
ncbi:MAG: transglycosylase SLT domain-containing protein, partial [Solirubrobacteraceae bacterium]